MNMLYLGIDFGTSFTKAVVFDPTTQKVHPVKIDDDSNKMPTVAYVENSTKKIKVGREAINSRLQPKGKFHSNFKPFIDCSTDDSRYDEIYHLLIVAILNYVKKCAEQQFKQEFTDVTLTVPASTPKYGIRWERMSSAASEAGFKNVEIILEPEAAAYCLLDNYIHSEGDSEKKQFLIYDFGGGTFDTSIVKVCDRQVFVLDKSVGSDNEQKWGGMYIDNLVRIDLIKRNPRASELAAKLQQEIPVNVKLTYSDKLLSIPVGIKEHLTYNDSSKDDYTNYTLSRNDFETMIKQMVDNTIDCSLSLLEQAVNNKLGEDIQSVQTVFLVGGSSRIPLVRSCWEAVKSSKQVSFSIQHSNLDVVAQGAAKYPFLKASSRQLNNIGIKKAKEKEYSKAALYFNNAGDGESLYWLGVLYYAGVIGRKRQHAKAYRYFVDSHFEDANLLMALMKFKNDGVLKDDKEAKKLLNNSPDSKLKNALIRVLNDDLQEKDLDTIYNFNPLSLFDLAKTTDNHQYYPEERVIPNSPELDVRLFL